MDDLMSRHVIPVFNHVETSNMIQAVTVGFTHCLELQAKLDDESP